MGQRGSESRGRGRGRVRNVVLSSTIGKYSSPLITSH